MCSGDFNQAKQSKYAMGLPPLSQRAISASLPNDLTDMERAVAASPGMFGRIWCGQGLAFDEAYQILMDSVHTHRYLLHVHPHEYIDSCPIALQTHNIHTDHPLA